MLPIGGLKEKSLAAYRAGVKTVIIPDENRRDLDDISDTVKQSVQFIPVKTLDEVLAIALSKNKKRDVYKRQEKAMGLWTEKI